MVYRIRAHHGMCFSFFQGKGYSGEFTENMWAMKKKLDGNNQYRGEGENLWELPVE